jgi:predicted dehydrogenase
MIARFHAQAIQELPGARLVALQSRKPENAAKVQEAVGQQCEVYTDLGEMLKRTDLHVVSVCTPSGNHLEPAVAAAQAGKHVVVEKPLEITLDRCDRIIEACDTHQVKLCTIFPSRFTDASQALKRAVDAGRFGKLTLGETTCKWWRPQSYYDESDWKGTQALDGGGALMNQAIHNVDLLQWMMGPVSRIAGLTATLAHDRIEVEDTAVACLRFASGALGVIEATTSVWPGQPKTIAIHGDKGSVVVEREDVVRWQFAAETDDDKAFRSRYAERTHASGAASNPASFSHEYHRRQFSEFVEAIDAGRKPLVDGRDGRISVEIILAIYKAMATGRVVEL